MIRATGNHRPLEGVPKHFSGQYWTRETPSTGGWYPVAYRDKVPECCGWHVEVVHFIPLENHPGKAIIDNRSGASVFFDETPVWWWSHPLELPGRPVEEP